MNPFSTTVSHKDVSETQSDTNDCDSEQITAMSDKPITPRRDGLYDREGHADCLLELSKHTRLHGQHLDKILSATNEMGRKVQEIRREMQAGFARINTRLHNIEAREKNEDAYLCRVDWVPLLKADGTTIANFPRDSEAVEDLDSMSTTIVRSCPR